MTQPSQAQHRGHHHGHGHDHGKNGHAPLDSAMADGMAEVLDLDAAATGQYVDDLVARISALAPDPRTVIDLGSGTGTQSVALARHYPTARIIGLDNSVTMLERVADAARRAGLDDRVHTLHADLDVAVPDELTDIDVAWSSSTMHHFADPAALLRSVHNALHPGGILVVVELDGLPAFLPPDSPEGALEARLQDIMSERGANAHPDWTPTITGAGFDLVDTIDIENPPVPRELTARYAVAWISRMRQGLDDDLSDTERATLDDLLDPNHPSSLHQRDDLSVRTRRTAWIARRSDHTEGEKP
ncbi:class I SAM-dependent methyltransferase [Gordonia sp. PKS22-38]|uniref:Class I SAM-dependent methyltransferase n=1 Tax=Gordonia prachuapensis TaxID=3115651 RepID=A0ABU7MNY1_9ACTN|nr:class I SAM-dependent methyltransferase [Gordonia sp. PKS22-38]